MDAIDKEVYKGITKSGGKLDADDPIGKAITVSEHKLGSGGEGTAWKGQLTFRDLDKEGWYQLARWIETHNELKANSGKVDHWDAAKERAETKLNGMSAASIESLVKDFWNERDLFKGRNEIAVRHTKLPADLYKRLSRQRYIVGMYDDNLAYTFHTGELKKSKRAYSILQLLDGELEPEKTKDWPIDVQLKIFRQIVKGLKRLHDFGIIHRDIKPANIFHRAVQTSINNPYKLDTQVKIADYGIMTTEAAEHTFETEDGSALGSPWYMPPEQAKDVTHSDWSVDQFAAGATFYHLLTGDLPIRLPSTVNASRLAFIGEARERQHKLPGFVGHKNLRFEGLQQIIARMMQIDPKKRYPDYKTIIEDLDRVERNNLPENTGSSYLRDARSGLFLPSAYDTYFTEKAARRNKWIAAGIGTAIAGAGAAAYLLGYLDPLLKR